MYNLYNTLKELCNKKGISLSKMCEEVKIPKSTPTELKMGRTKTLSSSTMLKVANYFNVSISYLLGEEEKEEKPVTKDELSDSRAKLIELAKSVPEDKVDLFLRVMQSIVEAE